MSLGVAVPQDVRQDAVRLVLMHDAEGKVLVLVPLPKLLNLANVWSLSGRKLQTVSAENAQRFFTQEALQSPRGLAHLMRSLPLLLDQSLQAAGALNLVELNSGLSFDWVLDASEHGELKVGAFGVSPAEIAARLPQGDDVRAISRAVERFTALRMQQRLEDTLGLPALAPTTQKIIMLRSDPDAGVDQLVPVVRIDPSLSAQVMSWAVSPYYAAPGKINSIDEAVIRVLGFDLVVNLALGIAMGQVLQVPEDTPRGSAPYWRQAVYTATLAEQLARKMPLQQRPQIGLVYLSGLLHNFGYLVLAHLFPPQFSILSRYIEANPHLEQPLVEQQVLNLTRDQIGAWLLENWQLPAEVCGAIRQQQSLQPQGEAEIYARLLRLTALLLRREGINDGPLLEIEAESYQVLGLSWSQIEETVQQLHVVQDDLDQLTHTLSRH